ncbi:6,7-dimethyl-8-ribityllumazine synthase [Thalassobaculum sp. OXR-137]|uniref:6,7-dimethyl-8-ribityllumazine synthase n=1 Tax=Thalassobaculum sp. OXR-137 TaxID=3100173 RepID=UPI002AC92E34|nr:6,7-dimethyl-8-ribityllumazine synthase [Thalassobaculum sp. OXR-137]WPZ33274.1 6,7-dimethyl-8-ribityllumazine synthase [Thalassobaculum sp. OXR-137]
MPRVLIVEARFYEDIADELVRGAIQHLEAEGVEFDRVTVPGAFEIPGAISMAHQGALKGGAAYDGYVALGCVIRGETTHYDYVCGESARGLMDLAVRENLAIGYGILTVENGDQAWARARVTEKNKGKDAAEACLAMVSLRHQFSLS